MDRNFFYALSILIGTIVGVGIFTLPYAFSQAGLMLGLIYLTILTVIIIYLHLAFGEIILRTNGNKRLAGYAKFYLPAPFKYLVNFSTIIGLFSSLLIYILVGGEFLSTIASNHFNIFYFYAIFWIIGSLLIKGKIKIFEISEFFMTVFLIIIIALITILVFPKINFENLTGLTTQNWFLPYGIIIFSLLGSAAVPEIRTVLKNKNKMKSVIITGTVISALIYLIFIFTVVGLSGYTTPKIATIVLNEILPKPMIFFVSILGFLLIITSYLTLGRYLKESLLFDFETKPLIANVLTIFTPFALIFITTKDFITIIAFVGALLGSFEGIITFLIYLKARKYGPRQPEYSLKIPNFFIYIFMIVLFAGFISTLTDLF